MSTLLRNGTTYFQIVEKYSAVLRKISVLHESVVNEFKPELEDLINKIELVIVELENTDSRTEKFFDLRRLLFQLEEIVDFRAIKRYNEIIEGKRPEAPSISDNFINSKRDIPVAKNDEPSSTKISNPKDVWNNVSEYLKTQLNVHTYNVWVKPVEYHSFDNGKIKVSVQNQFYKNWLEDHCSRIIKKYLNEMGAEYEVSFIVG